MANIDSYVEAIREAVYGEEVRGSIADAIVAMNDESAGAYSAATAARNSAAASANDASISAESAATSATDANAAKTSAQQAANNASNSAQQASQAATTAAQQAAEAAASQTATSIDARMYNYTQMAKSWAIGPNGSISQYGTDANNAYYWYLQVRAIAEGLTGESFLPMGIITFAQLPLIDIIVNSLYTISDEFTTDARFTVGSGHVIPPGANVYYTNQNKWVIMGGIPSIDKNEIATMRGNLLLGGTTVTLLSSGWTLSNDIYTQNVSVTGLLATDIVMVSFGTMTLANKKLVSKSRLTCASQVAGSLTFEAERAPTIDVPINVVVQGRTFQNGG